MAAYNSKNNKSDGSRESESADRTEIILNIGDSTQRWPLILSMLRVTESITHLQQRMVLKTLVSARYSIAYFTKPVGWTVWRLCSRERSLLRCWRLADKTMSLRGISKVFTVRDPPNENILDQHNENVKHLAYQSRSTYCLGTTTRQSQDTLGFMLCTDRPNLSPEAPR